MLASVAPCLHGSRGMQPRPPLAILLLAVPFGAGGCSSGDDARQDAGMPGLRRAELIATAATYDEPVEHPDGGQLRLEVTIANTGGIPVEVVGIGEGSLAGSGLSYGAVFTPAPEFAERASRLIGLGKQATIAFVAPLVASFSACLPAVVCEPNPHFGVLSAGGNLVTSVVSWQFSTDVRLSCVGAFPKICAATIAEACAAMSGEAPPGLRCLPHWADVLADRLCGKVDDDLISDCTSGYRRRIIRAQGQQHLYFYDVRSDSLVGITNGGCVAGPCLGFEQPTRCDEALPFYECR
jgi:hypothetical protein